MNHTKIEWTDFSANPLKFRDANGKTVWGCVHASPGCQHCYAETLAKRYGRGGPFNQPTMAKLTPFLDEKELRSMLTSKKISGKRVFVGDMTDIFGPWVPDEMLDRLFAVFALRSDVTWQVLTKRAERMRKFISTAGECDDVTVAAHALSGMEFDFFRSKRIEWPLPNVWLMVSCEDQERADERIPFLLQTPATVRGVSLEPLLAPINLSAFTGFSPIDPWMQHQLKAAFGPRLPGNSLNAQFEREMKTTNAAEKWVIIGGESGPGARPCDVAWIRSLVQQCASAETACFVKQLGSFPVALKLRDRKGGDMSEWREDLRVRQFPTTTVTA